MQIPTSEEEDLTIPEDSIHRATLLEIKFETVPYTDKRTGEPKSFDKLDWWWEIDDGPYTGRRVRGSTDCKLTTSPRNKLRNWVSVLLNREIDASFVLETDDLIGLKADIAIGHRPNRRDPSRVYEEVQEVLPASGDDLAPPF